MATTYEAVKQRAAAKDCLAARFQAEKRHLMDLIHQEGYEVGLRSASYLSREDFWHFERVCPLAAFFDPDTLEYLWTYLDIKEYPEEVRIHNSDFDHLLDVSNQCRVLFCQSWLDGVLHSWNLIKEQMDN
ncbi:MAG: hypothetical protein F6K30_30950 [Cyanothece sp. SIO2G6]|nr:hypothetical protein [Cyanothece sp. SIO2G6]